jgi:hypothetical protein
MWRNHRLPKGLALHVPLPVLPEHLKVEGDSPGDLSAVCRECDFNRRLAIRSSFPRPVNCETGLSGVPNEAPCTQASTIRKAGINLVASYRIRYSPFGFQTALFLGFGSRER